MHTFQSFPLHSFLFASLMCSPTYPFFPSSCQRLFFFHPCLIFHVLVSCLPLCHSSFIPTLLSHTYSLFPCPTQCAFSWFYSSPLFPLHSLLLGLVSPSPFTIPLLLLSLSIIQISTTSTQLFQPPSFPHFFSAVSLVSSQCHQTYSFLSLCPYSSCLYCADSLCTSKKPQMCANMIPTPHSDCFIFVSGLLVVMLDLISTLFLWTTLTPISNNHCSSIWSIHTLFRNTNGILRCVFA